MNLLRFENAVITSFQEKTNVKSETNYAVFTLEMDMSPEVAEELGCADQVYNKDETHRTNFLSLSPDLVMLPSRVSLGPIKGTPHTFEAEWVRGFTIYPDATTLKVACKIRVNQKLKQLHAHYNDTVATPHTVEIEELQQEMFDGGGQSSSKHAPDESPKSSRGKGKKNAGADVTSIDDAPKSKAKPRKRAANA